MTPPGPGRGGLRQGLKTAKGRSSASQRWLDRQLNDPYVAAAKAEGWRSRAAYKLIEMDDRFRLIRPGMKVIDLGAAPGGWTQVATQRVGPRGRVVGVDLLPMDTVAGATVIQADFTDPDVPARLMALLEGRPDLVLSDLAPNTTGHAATDHLRIVGLAETALDFALEHLAPGGGFVCKLFQGGAERDLLARLRGGFAQVRHAKPPASRKGSAEAYIVATGRRTSP